MSNQPALEITNLNKIYSTGTKALINANLKIEEGDFYGLLGANGAGKTTLIGITTGLVRKTSGSVHVHGLNIDTHPNEAKKLIGVVPQEFNFSIFEKVEDIVITQAGYFGIKRQEAIIRTKQLLKDLELSDKSKHPARTLSGGMKRRLMIARALVHNPKFLILDEPTAGVDVELRHGMWEYLKELNKNGTTILLTTHYLEEAEELCNNLAIVKHGEIIKTDSTQNLIQSSGVESYIAYLSATPKKLSQKFKKLDEGNIEIDITSEYSLQKLSQELNDLKIDLLNIKPKGNRLEQLFLKYIAE